MFYFIFLFHLVFLGDACLPSFGGTNRRVREDAVL